MLGLGVTYATSPMGADHTAGNIVGAYLQRRLDPLNPEGQVGTSKTAVNAVDMVFDTIKRSRKGLGFSDIQAKTGFGDKKIRNIIFRLSKIGRIKRKSRGIYVAA